MKRNRHADTQTLYLPPVYVVRREGNVLTRVCPSICLSTEGYPYPIMLCNITQNAMGQTPGGGVPISHNALQHYPECHGADTGGYPYPIMLYNISQNAMGQTPSGGTLPGPAGGGGTLPGGRGVNYQGGTLPGGYSARGYPARSSQGVPC